MSILRSAFPHQLQQVGPREEVPGQSRPESDVLAAKLEHARIHQPGRQSSGNRASFLYHPRRLGSWLVRFPLSFKLYGQSVNDVTHTSWASLTTSPFWHGSIYRLVLSSQNHLPSPYKRGIINGRPLYSSPPTNGRLWTGGISLNCQQVITVKWKKPLSNFSIRSQFNQNNNFYK